MKAIHGDKAKNDKIDSHKIAVLLISAVIPGSGLATKVKTIYVCPLTDSLSNRNE